MRVWRRVFNNRIYVAGGESITALNNSVSRAFEAYDPASNSWQAMGNMPLARYGSPAASSATASTSSAAISRRRSAAASR